MDSLCNLVGIIIGNTNRSGSRYRGVLIKSLPAMNLIDVGSYPKVGRRPECLALNRPGNVGEIPA
jgi:hypothetical protein